MKNSTLMWSVVGALVIIIALVGGYLWLSSDPDQNDHQVQQPTVAPTPTTPNQGPDQTETNNETVSADPVLVNETLLTNQIPENPTLAQEEIARLEDIQKQLNEQNETLKGQHKDADQLIQLKEEQIKILEQQVGTQNS